MTTCSTRDGASDNQESAIPGFISVRVVTLETRLQFECCFELESEARRVVCSPTSITASYCFEKYEPKHCTRLSEGEKRKRLPEKRETLEEDCKLSLLSRPQLTSLAV